jgi:hypothetical protein
VQTNLQASDFDMNRALAHHCPGPPGGRLRALSVFQSKSVLCGTFVYVYSA